MKSETSVFTVRLPVPIQKKLDKLAKKTDRSRSWLVARAVADFIHEQEAFINAVQEGIDAANKGLFATEAEVEAVFNKYIHYKPS